MKIAIIGDTHFGARSDSQIFLRYFSKFFSGVFFPYLEKHDIKTVVHLGDVVDRRKFINYYTLKKMRQSFMSELWNRRIDTHIIIGNHDTFYRNTNDVNAPFELFTTFDGVHEPWIYTEPKQVEFDGVPIDFVPWITKDNQDQVNAFVKNSKAQIAMGHFEFQGFEVIRGIKKDYGLDPADFNRYDMVISGHYHHKQDDGHVYYLGTPYEITWGDYGDQKGFHVFDTKTRMLEFVQNPYSVFHKIVYNDVKTPEPHKKSYKKHKDCYLKILVEEKKDPYIFDQFLDKIFEAGPANVVVLENSTEYDAVDADDTLNLAQDTPTLIGQYIDSLQLEDDKTKLKTLVNELYLEAVSEHIVKTG